ncbi:aminotransferase class V-fold PLP-dependent enzyme [Rhodococcus sp. BP-149]|uniref:aminotransferase class V-fold PLP-dependent enzyme n=1 Tax=unclassified Rhodococcus (in: high G+C Gram-positive bacteria) TaxID=192944 RepID=UPI001C9BA6F7|nr:MULTISPECIES: aminotransferase class V-fold PLP-dependent enzyme [unclassified Rhodococcus (in: high G+C Gram-positive bacteria)]MBY6685663.1 aminotransferase class V-fold PLP-dependent enzyme [Rhodococcus sp. BP-288]MBY6694789.1 aminotransferase class V-fold PLP-dependent enzyme [Rhodococcus sp. BP-188]MBY6696635.1 aminotransferase class V-fold PLP-dependent enzyme [Rhodococcus sp. BP-285]MBY6703291.1 aminotransferase class V-fold PLP-dependent enzyme [Rhodococcus sp. BP-283]MBY6710755.1 a
MNESARTLTGEDVARFRAETPGVSSRVHLNNAGAAMMATPVVDAVIGHVSLEAHIGGYEAFAESASRVDAIYDSIAGMIGASRDEIMLADSATGAWQRVFYSLTFEPGDRILTTESEFAANYVALLQVCRRTGATVDVIPDDSSGDLDLEALERSMDDRVRLISATWIPTNGGSICPAVEVGRIAAEHGATYLLDACQAVGQLEIDVEQLQCHVLTATGRKFLRGPRGTGFGYVRRDLLTSLEPAFIDVFGAPLVAPDHYELRDDARRFETWEADYAARLGLGVAVDYAVAVGIDRIRIRNAELVHRLRTGLSDIRGVTLRDRGTTHAAIVTLTHDAMSANDIKTALARYDINVSVSPPASTPLDSSTRRLPPVLRLSPHYYTTTDEVDFVVDRVRHIVRG